MRRQIRVIFSKKHINIILTINYHITKLIAMGIGYWITPGISSIIITPEIIVSIVINYKKF